MTKSTFSATHVLAGITSDGKKVVFTNLVASNAGDAAADAITIAPLSRVLGWNVGTKAPSGVTFTTSVTGNLVTVTPVAAMTSGVTILEVMSIGV